MHCGTSPSSPNPGCRGGGGQCPTGGITWPVVPYVASNTGSQVAIEWGVTPYGASSTVVPGTSSEGQIFSPNRYIFVSWWMGGEWVSGFDAFHKSVKPVICYCFTVTVSHPYCTSQHCSWECTAETVSCDCNSLRTVLGAGVQSTNLNVKQTGGGSNTLNYLGEVSSHGNIALQQQTTLNAFYPGGAEGFTNSAGFDFSGDSGGGYSFYVTGVTCDIWFNWTAFSSFYSGASTGCGGHLATAPATVDIGANLYDLTTKLAVFSPTRTVTIANGSSSIGEGLYGPGLESQLLQVSVPRGDTNSYKFTVFVLTSTTTYAECGSPSTAAGTGSGSPPTAFTFDSIDYRVL